MSRFIFCLIAFVAATSIAHAQSTQPADFLFTNGKVYTVDESKPWAEAVAVRGNLSETRSNASMKRLRLL